ncbi:MAG: hypothetical protein AAFQ21_05060 [Pseudomonadota bacterium]
MFSSLQDIAAAASALLAGAAVGMAWVSAIASPNCSYDRLDYSRADGHVRELLKRTSTPTAGVLLGAAALALLGGAMGAATLCFLAAAGFFSNTWTLAPQKKREVAPGIKRRPSKKSQRVVAVSLTLLFTVAALIGGVLAVFKV